VICIYMTRENGDPVPQYPLPAGYELKPLPAGGKAIWRQVMLDTGFSGQDIEGAFERDFAPFPEHFDRILMLHDTKTGRVAGSTSAWFNDCWQGGGWGQIHWVGIAREYQGLKLAKPMMSAAMNILTAHHGRSFLETQPIREKAIRMYLDYGFVPRILSSAQYDSWLELTRRLGWRLQLEHPEEGGS
jgi:ribosomal protein S18 acetylase RimI-like enzyme